MSLLVFSESQGSSQRLYGALWCFRLDFIFRLDSPQIIYGNTDSVKGRSSQARLKWRSRLCGYFYFPLLTECFDGRTILVVFLSNHSCN